jgi:HEAT repeat protein
MLRAALDDPEPMIRWNAAEALAHIGDVEAVTALRARSQRETHERVQRILALALDGGELRPAGSTSEWRCGSIDGLRDKK